MSSKTSLQHSQVTDETQPICRADNHSTYFKLFVESLVLKFKPLQIFCFSEETVLEEVQSCFKDEKRKHQCNYCLLLVTESTNRIDYEVHYYSNAYNKTTAFVALAKDLCLVKITRLEQAAECHREYAAQLSTN